MFEEKDSSGARRRLKEEFTEEGRVREDQRRLEEEMERVRRDNEEVE